MPYLHPLYLAGYIFVKHASKPIFQKKNPSEFPCLGSNRPHVSIAWLSQAQSNASFMAASQRPSNSEHTGNASPTCGWIERNIKDLSFGKLQKSDCLWLNSYDFFESRFLWRHWWHAASTKWDVATCHRQCRVENSIASPASGRTKIVPMSKHLCFDSNKPHRTPLSFDLSCLVTCQEQAGQDQIHQQTQDEGCSSKNSVVSWMQPHQWAIQ